MCSPSRGRRKNIKFCGQQPGTAGRFFLCVHSQPVFSSRVRMYLNCAVGHAEYGALSLGGVLAYWENVCHNYHSHFRMENFEPLSQERGQRNFGV